MVVRTLLIAALLTLAGESCLAQAETERSYLRPGTAEVGGISDLCLIYHGRQARVPWTKEALMPYVAHVDEQGTPQDWMFDSFLFIEFATDGGAMLHYYAKDKVQATAADWVWLADCWFREETGLIGLEQAVAAAGQALGDADHTVGVVITVPKPLAEIASFGPLAGETDTLDLSREESGQKVLAWYIERVLAQWGEHEYPHLRLLGFYWLAEGIGQGEHDLVKWTAEHVHERGYRLYWIPYFGAGGLQEWRNLGIDATMLQPNYFFHENATLYRFLATTKRALKAGSGIEIEFDGRALTDDTFRDKFYAYLDAGVYYGWMNDALLGYYEGGGAVKLFAETPGTGRELYDAVYRFVKGTYEMSGRTDFSGLELVARDNSDNLALASKGAKIHGCVRRDDYPELVPEKIIDGDMDNYGGMYGFGFFAWPNSFTIELPEAATVARTQTMLHDSVGQSFRYRIETSLDNQNWEPAVDKSEGEWQGWQVDKFAPRQAKYIRFTGLYNSANQNFQVIEFEVYPTHD